MKVEFRLFVSKHNENFTIVSNKDRILPNFSLISIIIGRSHSWYQIDLIYSLMNPDFHFNINFILHFFSEQMQTTYDETPKEKISWTP